MKKENSFILDLLKSICHSLFLKKSPRSEFVFCLACVQLVFCLIAYSVKYVRIQKSVEEDNNVCRLDHKKSSVFRSMSILFIVYKIWIVYCLGFCLLNSNYTFFACRGRALRRHCFYSLWIEFYCYYYYSTIFFTYHAFARHNFRRSYKGNKGIKSGFCCPKNINFSLKIVADQKQSHLNPEKLLRRVWT